MGQGVKYSKWKIILKYVRYYIRAGNAHSVHSPFVFSLYREVIKKDNARADFRGIESTRSIMEKEKMLHSCTYAPSPDGTARRRSIAEISRSSAIKPRYGRLLSRLVEHFKPGCILEIGTSLGISTLYLAKNFSGSRFISLEGCRECAARAAVNLKASGKGYVEIITGEFSQTLPGLLENNDKPDFVFVDGNHQYDAVLEYYTLLKPIVRPGSVLIFDDIHWSPGMERAWNAVVDDPDVTVTVDLFFFGLVFFREKQQKQHFQLRF